MNKKSKAVSHDPKKNHFSFCGSSLSAVWIYKADQRALKQFTLSLLCASAISQSNLACSPYSISWLKYNKGHKQLIHYLLIEDEKPELYTQKQAWL